MNLTPEVEALLVKARHALEVAEKLRAGGDFSRMRPARLTMPYFMQRRPSLRLTASR